tara:strand:- start:268 stop:432 length:165 start_codon:yes stop_codon:yes gene_type:complete
MCCKKCGGTLYGDGYSSVIACEYADETKVDEAEPDAGPIYCDYEESNECEGCTA